MMAHRGKCLVLHSGRHVQVAALAQLGDFTLALRNVCASATETFLHAWSDNKYDICYENHWR